jgi:hypothetical protein
MLHQRVTRCILIWLVGIMKLHSVGLRGPDGLSGEHPESPQPAGMNFIRLIFLVRHGPTLKPDGPDFWQPCPHVPVTRSRNARQVRQPENMVTDASPSNDTIVPRSSEKFDSICPE